MFSNVRSTFNMAVDFLIGSRLKSELLYLEPGSSWPVRVINVVRAKIKPANAEGGPATDATYELEFEIDRRARRLGLKFTHGEIKRLAKLGFRRRTSKLLDQALGHETVPAEGLILIIEPLRRSRALDDEGHLKI